eukprot:6473841-Amphidinium_carterae.1
MALRCQPMWAGRLLDTSALVFVWSSVLVSLKLLLWITSGRTLSMCNSPKDVAWAAKSKRTGLPVFDRCARCVRVVRAAFPLLTFDQVLLQWQASPEFKTKLEDALANYDGRKEKGFTPEGIAEEAWCGYRCEQAHTLVPERDLLQGRDLNPKELQKAIPVVELFNHKNEKVKGVLIPDGLGKEHSKAGKKNKPML